MTAKAAKYENVLAATADQMERDEKEIASLQRQKAALLEKIAVLQLNKTEAEIRLQTQLLKVHADYLDRLTALEQESDRLNNWIQGHVVTRDQEYENMRSNVSYLMGAHNP